MVRNEKLEVTSVFKYLVVILDKEKSVKRNWKIKYSKEARYMM